MRINPHTSTENTHLQNAEKSDKYSRAPRKENASEQTEAAEQVKRDSVEISREGRFAALQLRPSEGDILAQFNELKLAKEEQRRQFFENEFESNSDDFLKKIACEDYGHISKIDSISLNAILSDEQWAKVEQFQQQYMIAQGRVGSGLSAEGFIYNALNGKVENAREIASVLGNMVFDERSVNVKGSVTYVKITDPEALKAIAADREAGRDLAKYITENYFDDPMEAKAFMDKINEYIEKSEWQDHGMMFQHAESNPQTLQSLEMFPAPRDNQVQSIIDNAKLITDFSGNERWNMVMDLLSNKKFSNSRIYLSANLYNINAKFGNTTTNPTGGNSK